MPFLPLVMTFLSSRIAQLGLALLLGWGWGYWKADARWRESYAAERAAREVMHQKEVARQAENAREIAAAATQRAEDDASELAKLQKQIDNFDRSQSNVKDPCVMDDLFIDATGKLRQPVKRPRPAKVTRPTK